jgi:hypothetical protein
MSNSNLITNEVLLRKTLVIDILAWSSFGFGFLLFPELALRLLTNVKLDNVHIHMVRIFGLFCIYSTQSSYLLYTNKCDIQNSKFILQNKLFFSLGVLLLMVFVQYDAKDWSKGHYYGMFGLVLSMINNYIGLNSI